MRIAKGRLQTTPKATQRGTFAMAVVLLVVTLICHSMPSHGQLNTQPGADTNSLRFTVRVAGNGHFNTTNVTTSFDVMQGNPAYAAVVVNSRDFSSAVWTAYNGSISFDLGPTDGVYQIWFGLKDGDAASVPVWIGTTVYLNRTAPVLNITNPAPGTVMQPYIQVQGLADKRLSRVSYDISNALGVVTNLAGYVTGEFLDTKLLTFTTNYFQCYDVHLTNGDNLITVHAADWAGNSTSTDAEYTLDYTDKTNPPAITMTWPLGGEDISQSSITVYGTLSDPTASISLQATDTNGVTNIISGLVERDGHFWIQNVPVSTGTNWLSLTAQYVFGNTNLTAATNLIVTGNDKLGLKITSVTGDPWGPYSTVSGTISEGGYIITVNGVQATNDGFGNWTAHKVPNNPGNVSTFQVDAERPGDNPKTQSGAQTQN